MWVTSNIFWYFRTLYKNHFWNENNHHCLSIEAKSNWLVKEIISIFMLKMGIFDKCKFIHNNKELFPEMTLTQSGLENMTRILVISKQNVHGDGFPKWDYKLINIKFIKISKCINTNTNILNLELIDLLKLCLLKEISSKFNFLNFDDKRDKLEKELPHRN